MNNKLRFFSMIAFAGLIFSSCSKEDNTNNQLNFLKNGEENETEFNCQYVLDPAPQPLISMIDSPNDPREDTINKYLYHLARAISKYTCQANFETQFNSVKFNRYSGGSDGLAQDEAMISDLISSDPALETLIIAEFNAGGFSWMNAKNDFNWKGFSYEPTIWLENAPVADWSQEELIGVGTDVEYTKGFFGDFVPAFYNECRTEGYEPTEVVLGKKNDVDVYDTNVVVDPICLENPILIVQLSWDKLTKSKKMDVSGNVGGDNYDTLPLPLIDPPGCPIANQYDVVQFFPGCTRFDRGLWSESRIAYFNIEDRGPSYVYSSFPYRSYTEPMKIIHKNNMCSIHSVFENIWNISLVQSTLYSGYNNYLVSYEHDWYASYRGWAFPIDQGILPKVGMQRKGSHEHWQISIMKPSDFCVGRMKVYYYPYLGMRILGS